MTDPYKVLGVSPTDSDEKIKSAYRELARKYHPDAYVNNPLADLATEKMKEINEAYDEITSMRKKSGSGGNSSYGSYQSSNSGNSYSYGNYSNSGYRNSYSGSSQFSDIRRLINLKKIVEAEELLDGIPQSSRDAEWYFLKGSIFYTRGWTNEAYNYFNIAVNRDPNNQEYSQALSQLQWQRQQGYPSGGGYNGGYSTTSSSCSGCDICESLFCADCCCECMGGDLIRCC